MSFRIRLTIVPMHLSRRKEDDIALKKARLSFETKEQELVIRERAIAARERSLRVRQHVFEAKEVTLEARLRR
jgi:hypothetical protein